MKRSALHRDEGGAVLVIVALLMTVLLGGAALAMDWGYGLNARRIMQSSADGSALAAGVFMARNVVEVSKTAVGFRVTQEQVWCEAYRLAYPNWELAPTRTGSLTIEFGVGDPPTFAPSDTKTSVANCTSPATSTLIPSGTLFVRARSTETYRSLLASVVGQPSVTAAASARVRLSGSKMSIDGPTLPMVRHFNPNDFICGLSCSTSTPFEFWSPQVAGAYKGAVDFSRYSPAQYPTVSTPQLIKDYDHNPSIPKSQNPALAQCAVAWLPSGNQNQDKCDIPGWFAYTFQGSLKLDNPDWAAQVPSLGPRTHDDNALPNPQRFDKKDPITGSCLNLSSYMYAPSCGADATHYTWGDWVETASTGGAGDGTGFKDYIQNNPGAFLTPLSYQPVGAGTCGDPLTDNNCYGKAIVALVFLWDCAESTDKNGNWALLFNPNDNTNSDCSALSLTPNNNKSTPDLGKDVARVHLVTVVPFTFYHGLALSSSISGFWGGQLAAPGGSCGTSCPLSPFANNFYLNGD